MCRAGSLRELFSENLARLGDQLLGEASLVIGHIGLFTGLLLLTQESHLEKLTASKKDAVRQRIDERDLLRICPPRKCREQIVELSAPERKRNDRFFA